MIRRSHSEIIDFNEGDNDSDSIIIKSYCKHCQEFGFRVPLKNRIYPEGQPIRVDHENWLQCYECGSIYAVYEIEKESSIKDVVETSDNPFDSGIDFLGIDSRKARKKRMKDEEDYNYINDEDLKRDLASGQTILLSYTES